MLHPMVTSGTTGMEGKQPMSAVLFEVVEPHIALVTINRPEARNAVNGAVAAGLEAAVERVEADGDIWAAILTGAGPVAFCAGQAQSGCGRGRRVSAASGGAAGSCIGNDRDG
jgi:enoyl-CoA hydratase/carnithine racemase